MKIRLAFLLVALAPASVRAGDFSTGQSAGVVLGKSDFTSNQPAFPLRNNTGTVCSVAEDPTTGKVFVVDTINSRVLRFSSAAAAQSGANAEAVIGQPDYFSNQTNRGNAMPAANSLKYPFSAYVDYEGRLWVSDSSNNRILCYGKGSDLPEFGATAIFVIGQPNFTDATSRTTQAGLDYPAALWVSTPDTAVDIPGTLWVVDASNSRVLHYNNAYARGYNGGAPVNNITADGVIGQPNFNTGSPKGGQSEASDRQKFYYPYGLTGDDGGRIFVADTGNNRVLVFDNAANLNGLVNASKVLGQIGFTSNKPNQSDDPNALPTASTLDYPYGVAVIGARLWVADSYNNRVVWYDRGYDTTFPNGQNADGVLGQPDLTSHKFNQSDDMNALPTAATLGVPNGVAATAAGGIWVADTSNLRAVLHLPAADPTPAPKPAVTVTGKKTIVTTKSSLPLKGTAKNATKVEVKVGKAAYKKAKGTTKWTFKAVLSRGKNTILVKATGPGGATKPVKVTVIRK